MKIICNKDEFALLVRSCSTSSREEHCCGCIFAPVCSQDHDISEEFEIMDGIEDICEIEVTSNGDLP